MCYLVKTPLCLWGSRSRLKVSLTGVTLLLKTDLLRSKTTKWENVHYQISGLTTDIINVKSREFEKHGAEYLYRRYKMTNINVSYITTWTTIMYASTEIRGAVYSPVRRPLTFTERNPSRTMLFHFPLVFHHGRLQLMSNSLLSTGVLSPSSFSHASFLLSVVFKQQTHPPLPLVN